MVDAVALEATGRKLVQVRVLSPVPIIIMNEVLLNNTDIVLFLEEYRKTDTDIIKITGKDLNTIKAVKRAIKDLKHQKWIKKISLKN